MKQILFLLLFFTTAAYSQSLNIIPQPQQVILQNGKVMLTKRFNITYNDNEALKSANQLQGYLYANYGLKLSVAKTSASNAGKRISFVHKAVSPGDEAYVLKVNASNITVQGAGAGLFYGLQTLMQIFALENGAVKLPCVNIEDWPRYAYRGIMQGVGYHFYPVSFIKSQIDMLARYKMNVYHWHLTEDHGWRIEIKKYPKLTSVGAFRAGTQVSNYNNEYTGNDKLHYGGFYTQQEIRDVVAYAAQRHVTIIPEIELPGHTLAALAAYPYLGCGDNPGPFKVAETWGIFDDVYCAGKESTFKFLQDVLTEVIELFPSKYIHIGGDECPKERWKTCKYCQQRIIL